MWLCFGFHGEQSLTDGWVYKGESHNGWGQYAPADVFTRRPFREFVDCDPSCPDSPRPAPTPVAPPKPKVEEEPLPPNFWTNIVAQAQVNAATNLSNEKLINDLFADPRARERALQEISRLEIGFIGDYRNTDDQDYPSYQNIHTVPERDGKGEVIGVGTRAQDATKKFLKGGERGAIYAKDWDTGVGPVFLPEGMTCSLSCMVAGLSVVGRPSSRGNEEHFAELLKDIPLNRPIIVILERDKSGEGIRGGQRFANRLSGLMGRPIEAEKVPDPKDKIKDFRAWLSSRLAADPNITTRQLGESFASQVDPRKQSVVSLGLASNADGATESGGGYLERLRGVCNLRHGVHMQSIKDPSLCCDMLMGCGNKNCKFCWHDWCKRKLENIGAQADGVFTHKTAGGGLVYHFTCDAERWPSIRRQINRNTKQHAFIRTGSSGSTYEVWTTTPITSPNIVSTVLTSTDELLLSYKTALTVACKSVRNTASESTLWKRRRPEQKFRKVTSVHASQQHIKACHEVFGLTAVQRPLATLPHNVQLWYTYRIPPDWSAETLEAYRFSLKSGLVPIRGKDLRLTWDTNAIDPTDAFAPSLRLQRFDDGFDPITDDKLTQAG